MVHRIRWDRSRIPAEGGRSRISLYSRDVAASSWPSESRPPAFVPLKGGTRLVSPACQPRRVLKGTPNSPSDCWTSGDGYPCLRWDRLSALRVDRMGRSSCLAPDLDLIRCQCKPRAGTGHWRIEDERGKNKRFRFDFGGTLARHRSSGLGTDRSPGMEGGDCTRKGGQDKHGHLWYVLFFYLDFYVVFG